MTNRIDIDRSATPPASRGDDVGPLAGFDRLKGNLDRVTAAAVAGRLRAGQGPDQIRAEVPMTAARRTVELLSNAAELEESVFAYVAGRVEAELAGAGETPG